MKDMKTLRDRIEWALTNSGKRQIDIARHIGISPASVSGWLSGDTQEISSKHIFEVARLLKVEPEWLATGKGARTPEEQTLRNTVTPLGKDAVEMAKDWIHLRPPEREAFRVLVSSLIGLGKTGRNRKSAA